MTEPLSTPEPTDVTSFTPTFVAALSSCGYRAAYMADDRFSGLRRGSAQSALGNAAHNLTEQVTKGALADVAADQRRSAVEAAWDAAVHKEAEALAAQWAPAAPPPPSEWPGYQLTKVRTVRSLVRSLEERTERSASSAGGGTPPQAEVSVRDDASGLWGRPDLVEQRDGALRVVDLKTGIRQGEMTDAQRRQLHLYAYLVWKKESTWPAEIAVRDASGQDFAEPLEPKAAKSAVDQAVAAVGQLNEAVTTGPDAVAALARPAGDVCRWCPFRVVCAPYWDALQLDWVGHVGIVGTVASVVEAPRGDVATITSELPGAINGEAVTIGAVPHGVLSEGSSASIVDADRGQSPLHLRARWSTYYRVA